MYEHIFLFTINKSVRHPPDAQHNASYCITEHKTHLSINVSQLVLLLLGHSTTNISSEFCRSASLVVLGHSRFDIKYLDSQVSYYKTAKTLQQDF